MPPTSKIECSAYKKVCYDEYCCHYIYCDDYYDDDDYVVLVTIHVAADMVLLWRKAMMFLLTLS